MLVQGLVLHSLKTWAGGGEKAVGEGRQGYSSQGHRPQSWQRESKCTWLFVSCFLFSGMYTIEKKNHFLRILLNESKLFEACRYRSTL